MCSCYVSVNVRVCDGVSMHGNVDVCVHVDVWMRVGVCRCECMDLFVPVSVCMVYMHECVCVYETMSVWV